MYGIYNYKNDINIFWFLRKFSYYCYLKSNEQSSFYFNYCWKYTDRNLRSFNFSFYSISIFSSLIRSFDLIPHIFGFSEYKSRIDKLNLSSLPPPFLPFYSSSSSFFPLNFRNFDNDVWGISYVNFRFAKNDTNEVSYNFCREYTTRGGEGGGEGNGQEKLSCFVFQ